MSEVKKKRDLKGLKEELECWLEEKRYDNGVKYYSCAEWKERGEDVGSGSALTVIIEESALCHALNYSSAEHFGKVDAELTTLANRHGFYYEIGFSWSIHFYPCD